MVSFYHEYFPFVNKVFKCLLLSLALSATFSCASNKIPAKPVVHLTNKAAVPLLPTTATDHDIQMLQHLTGTYGGQVFQMDAYLVLNQREINATFMNSFGTTMGSLMYTADTMEFHSAILPRSINPAYIVFDFQLCFYHEAALRQELEGAGLQLKSTVSSEHRLREVYDEDRLLITILQSAEKIEFSNLERGYSYTIYGDFNETK